MAVLKRIAGWLNASLLRQFTALILMTGALILLSSGMFVSHYFENSMINAIEAVERDYLKMQAENVRIQMRNYRNMLYEYVTDAKLLSSIKQYQSAPVSERAGISSKIREQLSVFAQTTDGVAASLVMNDGELLFRNRLKSETKNLGWFAEMFGKNYNQHLNELVARSKSARNAVIGVLPTKFVQTNTYLIHMTCPVFDIYTRDIYAVLIMSFNTRTLQEMVNPSNSSAAHKESSIGVLTDENGIIITHEVESEIGKTLLLAGEPELEGVAYCAANKDEQMLEEPLGILGLRVYRIIARDKLLAEPYRYRLNMSITLALIVAACLMMATLGIRHTMRSVRALQKGLQTVDAGELDVQVDVDAKNEIGHIVHSFNEMTRRLKQSDEVRRDKEQEAIQALNQQRIAEVKALENQINSHFLYNTLNSINFSALAAGNLDVSREIKHLSKMLRYTFERSDGIVTAAQDAEWLGEYLALQKLRFGEAFDYSIRVDAAVASWPMRKLLLQPFVENSVMHGLLGITSGGWIKVSFQMYDGEHMRVTIEDNGHGMTPEKVSLVNRMLKSGIEPSGDVGIGLENAYLRTISYYGGTASVIMRSWIGIGTKAVLLLPRYTGEPQGDQ